MAGTGTATRRSTRHGASASHGGNVHFVKDYRFPIIVLSLTFCALAGVVVGAQNGLLGLATFILALGAFIAQGFFFVNNDPQHVALVTFFGRYTEVVKGAGWHWLPLRNIVLGYILVDAAERDLDFADTEVTTPDQANLRTSIGFKWKIEETPEKIVTFISNRRDEGVIHLFDNIVTERFREWFFSKKEGPKTWMEAMGAGFYATAVLLRAIVSESVLPRIDSDIPTIILMKYFRERGLDSLTKEDAEKWGAKLSALPAADLGEDDTAWSLVRQQVQKRIEAVQRARQGNGGFSIPQLGILLEGINLGKIMEAPGDPIIEAGKQKNRAVLQAEADRVKIQNLRDRAREIMEESKLRGITSEQAYLLAQIQMGVVKKDVLERTFGGSPELLRTVKELLEIWKKK